MENKNIPFKPNKEFKYSITYTITTDDSAEMGEYADSGFEVEPTESAIGEIIKMAHRNYGIYNPIAIGRWESTSPIEDKNYFEKGESRFFNLHITNIDGSDLDEEEHEFITYLLTEGEFDQSDYEDFGMGGSTSSKLSWHQDRARYNKSEDYEIPMSKRKFAKGGGGVDDFKMSYDEMTAYEKSNHIHYNPMNSRWEVTKNGEHKEFWNQEQAEKYAGFEFDDEKDSRYSRKRYEALFGYSDGGDISEEANLRNRISNLKRLYNMVNESEKADLKYTIDNLEAQQRNLHKMEKGGSTEYNHSWHFDHDRHNKSEDYEIPMSKRKFDDGGGVEGHKHVLHIDGQNWFLEKIDSTHFYMSNDQNLRGVAHHIGQHKGEPYYEEVREWLKSTYAKGGGVDDKMKFYYATADVNYFDEEGRYKKYHTYKHIKAESEEKAKMILLRFLENDLGRNEWELEFEDIYIQPSTSSIFNYTPEEIERRGYLSAENYGGLSKEKFSKGRFDEGGGVERITEKDFVEKKQFKRGNTIIKLEKLSNPTYYRVRYIDLIDNESSSYGSPNFQDVIFDINETKYAVGGGVDAQQKYEVTLKNDKHYGQVGVSLYGWNLDKRGTHYLTLQFPNGSVSTYGEGEIKRIYAYGGNVGSGWIWKNGTITTDFDETIKILRQNHYPNNNLDDDRLLELAVSDDIVYWTYFDEYREDIPYWVLNILKSKNVEYAVGGGVEDWMETALNDLKEKSSFDDLEIEYPQENTFSATNGDVEYFVCKDDDVAEDVAIERVMEDMNENPEYFNREFIMNHIDCGDFFENIYREWNMGYATDISTEDDDQYGNRLIAEMVEWGIMSKEDAKGDDAEEIMSERMEDFVEAITEDQLGQDKGFQYYVDNFGEEEAFNIAIDNGLIDIKEASEEAVSIDGIGHFLSSYDGKMLYLENGSVAFRNN